ncbi:hypothetical protein BB559_000004 [Furculomyces boomerangus]|uniref:SUN domain-containing protein n=2 Tax=Harpellales TaxID=61421 RepID=A0A2T9Z6L3_9FUNG|nr:hypothetical protein BB559_000004 [Furculomyces boomerangus]PVZ99379.1 hypothetical protein BB558_004612 [Smittium angustum]
MSSKRSFNQSSIKPGLSTAERKPLNFFKSLMDTPSQHYHSHSRNLKPAQPPQVLQLPTETNPQTILRSQRKYSSSSTESISRMLFAPYNPNSNNQNDHSEYNQNRYSESKYKNSHNIKLRSNIHNYSNSNSSNSVYTDNNLTEVDYSKQDSPKYIHNNYNRSDNPSNYNFLNEVKYNVQNPLKNFSNGTQKLNNSESILKNTNFHNSYTNSSDQSSTEDEPDPQNYNSKIINIPNSIVINRNQLLSRKGSDKSLRSDYYNSVGLSGKKLKSQKSVPKTIRVGGPGAFPKTALRYSQKKNRSDLYFDPSYKNFEREQTYSPTSMLRKKVLKNINNVDDSFQRTDMLDHHTNNQASTDDNFIQVSTGSSGFLYLIRSGLAFLFSKIAFVVLIVFYLLKEFLVFIYSYSLGYLINCFFPESPNSPQQSKQVRRRNTVTIITGLAISTLLLAAVLPNIMPFKSLLHENSSKDAGKNKTSTQTETSISYILKKLNPTWLFDTIFTESIKNDDTSDNGRHIPAFENLKTTDNEILLDLYKEIKILSQKTIKNSQSLETTIKAVEKLHLFVDDQGRQIQVLQSIFKEKNKENDQAVAEKVSKLLTPSIEKKISDILEKILADNTSSKLGTNDENFSKFLLINSETRKAFDEQIELVKYEISKINSALTKLPTKVNENIVYSAKPTSVNSLKPDFALFSAGARIIPRDTSPSWNPTPKLLLAKVIHKLGLIEYPVNPPSTALNHNTNLGECWPMRGQTGQLAIRLARPINPKEFMIEHVPKSAAIDWRSAPKDIEVWGYVLSENSVHNDNMEPTESSDEEYAAAFTVFGESDDNGDNHLNSGSQKQKIKPKKQSSNLVKLGKYTYNPSDEYPAQKFELLPSAQNYIGNTGKVQVVILKINSNWDNKVHTCLYRFSVYSS